MRIQGLQKVTLLDYPGLVACTVFTGGCNLRCPFCHNASLVTGPLDSPLDAADFFFFLEKRRSVLDGVCVTGGEPLLQPDILDFLRKIKDLGYRVKLDTNGTFPERLFQAAGAGLIDRVAMDIKNAPDRYAKTVGIPEFDTAPVLESAKILMEGSIPFEFRTTVVYPLHQPEDFERISRWLAGPEEFYLQQFKDSGDLIRPEGLWAYSDDAMRGFADTLKKDIPNTHIRGIEE